MDGTLIATFLGATGFGGVLTYFIQKIIDKFLNKDKDKEDVKEHVISNSNEIAKLYLKIDEIVEAKTAPIIEELTEIKQNWCCYRQNCDMRISSSFKLNSVKKHIIKNAKPNKTATPKNS